MTAIAQFDDVPLPINMGLCVFGRVHQAIYLIRGQNVMLDRDLAVLYGVPTKALKQAVRRNLECFPDDFIFVVDASEFQIWRSQFVTSSKAVAQGNHKL